MCPIKTKQTKNYQKKKRRISHKNTIRITTKIHTFYDQTICNALLPCPLGERIAKRVLIENMWKKRNDLCSLREGKPYGTCDNSNLRNLELHIQWLADKNHWEDTHHWDQSAPSKDIINKLEIYWSFVCFILGRYVAITGQNEQSLICIKRESR